MPNGRYTLKRLSSLQQRYGANVDWDVLDGDAQWRHLTNTTEPSVCFMSNYSDHLLLLRLLICTDWLKNTHLVKKCIECEVEGSRPRGREVVQKRLPIMQSEQ